MTPKEAIDRIVALGFQKTDIHLSDTVTTVYDIDGTSAHAIVTWELTAWADGKKFVTCETGSKLEQLVERMELRYGEKKGL